MLFLFKSPILFMKGYTLLFQKVDNKLNKFIITSSAQLISITEVSRDHFLEKAHSQMHESKRLIKKRVFNNIPSPQLEAEFHKKLSKTYSNPRSILKLYLEYSKKQDKIEISWLVRCFGQLGNIFGFNSFWSVKDKQSIQSTLGFKSIIYDLIENQHLIIPKHVPRIIYSMASLEYRIWQICPTLLDILMNNLKLWRTSTLAIMILSLSYLGIGDPDGDNVFGNNENGHVNYQHIITSLILEVYSRIKTVNDYSDMTPFLLSGICYSMILFGIYDIDPFIIPNFLNFACSQFTIENISHSGWVQFFLYQILYCTDVEKPSNELLIKNSIPLEIQESLYSRWINDILIKGQPQGSEEIQSEVDTILSNLKENESLMNCSIGRPSDEQHGWFVGHFIKSRNLVLEYDYLQAIGPGRPKLSGILQCKKRLLLKLGLHVAYIHRSNWKYLNNDQKYQEITRILSNFSKINEPDLNKSHQNNSKLDYLHYLKHKKKEYTTWPPDKIIF